MIPAGDGVVVNGWTILLHPLLLDELEDLIAAVERLRAKDRKAYRQKRPTKKLAAILKLILEVVPGDPSRPEYRQGGTLGADYKHWFRAKFAQQYRLFFRYSAKDRILVFVWVNDEQSLRAYGSKSDAYVTFAKMLGRGNPPDDWDALIRVAQRDTTRKDRLLKGKR
jgi:toxin YhaV